MHEPSIGDMTAADDFIAQKTFAIVGASRDRNKFGNIVLRNLRAKGYRVIPVNPSIKDVEGERCYPNLASLPEKVDGVVTVVPPPVTEKIVREAHASGIKRVWMQEGSESLSAIRYCRDNGMSVISGACVMVVSNHRKPIKPV
jgi:hypothetical protein